MKLIRKIKVNKTERSDKKKTDPEETSTSPGANVGDIPLGGLLDMALSGYTCRIGLGGPEAAKSIRRMPASPSMAAQEPRRLWRWRHTWRIRIGLLRLAGYVLTM